MGIYQQVIAKVLGVIYMDPMDQSCFIGTSKWFVNVMSVTGFNGDEAGKGFLTEEDARKMFRNEAKRNPKFRYKIHSFLGDLYYKEMSVDEAMEKGFNYFSSDYGITS